MRITASIDELVARLQAHKQRERERYEAARAAYPELEAAYRRRVVAALERELERVKAGRPLPCTYGSWNGNRRIEGVIVGVGAMPPAKPSRPELGAIDRRIKELRLSSRDELSIDTASKDWRGLFHAIAER